MSATVPKQLPMLSQGSHPRPEDGACLMEYVSVLAGESFSDRPRCTHPLLTRLAQRVNDLSTDGARNRLAVLAPALIGTNNSGTRATAALVACCAEAARATEPATAGRDRQVRRARRRLARLETEPVRPPRGWARRMVDVYYWHCRASVDIEAALTTFAQCPAGAGRDEALYRLLVAACQACAHTRDSDPSRTGNEHPQTHRTGGWDVATPQHTPQKSVVRAGL